MSTAVRLTPEQPSALISEHDYSVSELAEKWNLSADTIRRQFENEPGVIVWENPHKPHRRRFRTLRIPGSVAQRVRDRNTRK
jgi:hypothetical protein